MEQAAPENRARAVQQQNGGDAGNPECFLPSLPEAGTTGFKRKMGQRKEHSNYPHQ